MSLKLKPLPTELDHIRDTLSDVVGHLELLIRQALPTN